MIETKGALIHHCLLRSQMVYVRKHGHVSREKFACAHVKRGMLDGHLSF